MVGGEVVIGMSFGYTVLVDGLKANNRIRFYVNNPLHKDFLSFLFYKLRPSSHTSHQTGNNK